MGVRKFRSSPSMVTQISKNQLVTNSAHIRNNVRTFYQKLFRQNKQLNKKFLDNQETISQIVNDPQFSPEEIGSQTILSLNKKISKAEIKNLIKNAPPLVQITYPMSFSRSFSDTHLTNSFTYLTNYFATHNSTMRPSNP